MQCWHKAHCRKLGTSVEAQAAVLPKTETPGGAHRERMKLILEQIGLRTVGWTAIRWPGTFMARLTRLR